MLDFGFSEILLTSAIALVVLGPERLPRVARQVGNWMGRARAMARQLSEQLEREVSAEDFLKEQTKAAAAQKRIAPAQTMQTPPTAPPQGSPSQVLPTDVLSGATQQARNEPVPDLHAIPPDAEPPGTAPAPHEPPRSPPNE